LDAFVIPRDIVVQSEYSGEDSSSATPEADAEAAPEADDSSIVLTDPVITDTAYRDSRISIEIRTMRTLSTNVYIADITLTDPGCVRTALAENSFGRNVTDTTSSMAVQNNAILAINGDYYGFRSSGYVMRNGYLYRSEPADDPEQEDLVHYPDGSFEIVREADVSARELEEAGAVDIFSFGPGLIIDGEISVKTDDEVDRAQVTNPRTALGVISPLHYLFIVSDGRTDESTGLSLLQLAELMKELGCRTAYNLDGGGSSTIWFNGRVLNRPTTFGDKIEERSLSDIIYIGS
jgi:exopolysaccharide biosynthesis protein